MSMDRGISRLLKDFRATVQSTMCVCVCVRVCVYARVYCGTERPDVETDAAGQYGLCICSPHVLGLSIV